MKLMKIEKADTSTMSPSDVYSCYYEGLYTPRDVYQFYKYLQTMGFTIGSGISVIFDRDLWVTPISFTSPEEFFESSSSIDWEDVQHLSFAGQYNKTGYLGAVCPGNNFGLFVLSIPKGSVLNLDSTSSENSGTDQV